MRRRRRVPLARGANEGVGPESPPIPVLTIPPAAQGQDANAGDDDEDDVEMGEEIARRDPTNEDTWFRVTDENKESFFRTVHGRKLNVIQPTYQLPSDADENKVRLCLTLLLSCGKYTDDDNDDLASGVLPQDALHGHG